MNSRQALIQPSSMTEQPTWLDGTTWHYKVPAAFVFGALLGLSSAGFDVWWLAWIGLAPLLVLIRGAGGRLEAAIIGLVFGLGYHGVSLSWYLGLAPLSWLGLHESIGTLAAVFVWLLEVVHQSTLMLAFSLLVFCLPLRAGFLPNVNRPFFPYLISIPIIWVFLQWVIAPSDIFVGLPINQLAYSQYKQLSFIQSASFLGSGGIDFLLVMVNAVVANLILEITAIAKRLGERTDKLRPRFGSISDLAVTALVVALASSWGADRVNDIHIVTEVATARDRNIQTPPVPVAVLQGNVSVEEERLKITKPDEIARRYRALGGNLGAQILVLPEGVINSSQMQKGRLLNILTDITENQDKEVVVGSIETLSSGHVNAARLLSPKKKKTKDDIYLKRRLVPLAESAPIRILNERIPAPVRERIPATREAFMASRSTHLVKSIWGKVGLSIYIELVYPKLIAEEVRKGASLLVNVSNLSWFHEASINRQLLAAAVFRAVENGRYLVLATNTGVSAIVAPSGMIDNISLAGQRGVLLNTIQFLYNKTPYSRMWWM